VRATDGRAPVRTGVDPPTATGDDVVEDNRIPPPRHPAARRWLTTGVVVALLVAIAVYLSRTHEELSSLQRLSVRVLAGAWLLQIVSQLALNGSMLLPLRTSVTDLGFWELYLVRTGGFLVGSLMPVAGGIAVRLAYLRNRGVTYLDFTWATMLSNVLALAAAAVVAVAATGVLWSLAGRPPAAVLAVSAGVLSLSVAALAVFEYLPRLTRGRWLQRWRWLSAMSSLRASRAVTIPVFALCLLRHLVNFGTFGLLSQSLSGDRADFLAGGLLYALTSPVRMVNITPGNLGVTEWIVAVVGKVLAFDLAIGLVVALAFRGLSLVAQAAGALIGSAWLALRKRA